MRGEGGTIPCPGCLEQHRAVYRLDGLAVLDCPSVETPGELRMRSVPRTVHSSTFVFLRGPEHAPVEVDLAPVLAGDSETEKAARAEQPDPHGNDQGGALQEADPITRRRRTA